MSEWEAFLHQFHSDLSELLINESMFNPCSGLAIIIAPLTSRPSHLGHAVIKSYDPRAREIFIVSENSVPLNPMVNDHYPY